MLLHRHWGECSVSEAGLEYSVRHVVRTQISTDIPCKETFSSLEMFSFTRVCDLHMPHTASVAVIAVVVQTCSISLDDVPIVTGNRFFPPNILRRRIKQRCWTWREACDKSWRSCKSSYCKGIVTSTVASLAAGGTSSGRAACLAPCHSWVYKTQKFIIVKALQTAVSAV